MKKILKVRTKVIALILAALMTFGVMVPATTQNAYAFDWSEVKVEDLGLPKVIQCGLDADAWKEQVEAEEQDILNKLDNLMSSMDMFNVKLPGALDALEKSVDTSKLEKSLLKALDTMANSQNPFGMILSVGQPIIRYIMFNYLRSQETGSLNVQRVVAYDVLGYEVAKESGIDLFVNSATSAINQIVPGTGTVLKTIVNFFRNLFS